MTEKLTCISLLSLACAASACFDDASRGTDVAETSSALSGAPRDWQDVATHLCLDSNGNGSVYTLSCNDGGFQRWTNVPSTFGDQIIDQETNRCLDSNLDGDVYTLPCNGGAFQQWTVRDTGRTGYEMRNVATGFCLDSDGSGHVYTLECNDGNFQRWSAAHAVVCGRSMSGIQCAVASRTIFGSAPLWQGQFSDANSWNAGPQYYSTIRLVDVDGDGRSDVCGRGFAGVDCALSTGASFGSLNVWQGQFSDGNGWASGPQYYSTIQFGDLDGDGRSDVCGRGYAGLDCALSTGAGFGPLNVWQPRYSDAAGWNSGPQYYSTIQLADLDGDGKADVCGRGVDGILCALSAGAGGMFQATIWQPSFSDANSWGAGPQYYSTIRLVDVNGDGKADLCARGFAGILCALSDGTRFGNVRVWQGSFSDANGWASGPQYYSTIQFADLNGDGKLDVCGRASSGMLCALSNGAAFGGLTMWQDILSDSHSWGQQEYYSTIRLVDVNGDGKADLCARGISGIDCALSNGTSFGELTVWQAGFSDANNWNAGPQYYSTFQFGLER